MALCKSQVWMVMCPKTPTPLSLFTCVFYWYKLYNLPSIYSSGTSLLVGCLSLWSFYLPTLTSLLPSVYPRLWCECLLSGGRRYDQNKGQKDICWNAMLDGPRGHGAGGWQSSFCFSFFLSLLLSLSLSLAFAITLLIFYFDLTSRWKLIHLQRA